MARGLTTHWHLSQHIIYIAQYLIYIHTIQTLIITFVKAYIHLITKESTLFITLGIYSLLHVSKGWRAVDDLLDLALYYYQRFRIFTTLFTVHCNVGGFTATSLNHIVQYTS